MTFVTSKDGQITVLTPRRVKQQALADQLSKSGSDTSPVAGGAGEAIVRALSGVAGGFLQNQALETDKSVNAAITGAAGQAIDPDTGSPIGPTKLDNIVSMLREGGNEDVADQLGAQNSLNRITREQTIADQLRLKSGKPKTFESQSQAALVKMLQSDPSGQLDPATAVQQGVLTPQEAATLGAFDRLNLTKLSNFTDPLGNIRQAPARSSLFGGQAPSPSAPTPQADVSGVSQPQGVVSPVDVQQNQLPVVDAQQPVAPLEHLDTPVAQAETAKLGGKEATKARVDYPKAKFALQEKIASDNRVISSIDRAIGLSNSFGATGMTSEGIGPVGGLSSFGGLPAGELRKELDFITSNEAIASLERMRSSSSSGASGMGALSERELDVIKDVRQNLRQGSSDEVLRADLQRLRDVITKGQPRYLELFNGTYERFGLPKFDMPKPEDGAAPQAPAGVPQMKFLGFE